ncbi:MAG TPA: MarC family protein [Nitrospirae bacterium]|nr:MarC family protein [Nitrospirota bacterium]HDL21116.1 MarC family protein [Nitrospirota bacterium]HDZ01552.1 MarC family protein [Nitrospirota bacterium]
MPEILKDLPLTFIPLFVAMDPFGILPIFMSITVEMTGDEKIKVIRYSTISALAICLGFIVVGEAVFKILGITVDDFKIAGGLLLLVIAIIELVGQKDYNRKPHDVGIVPIGVPLLVGPAVLTTLIVLVDHYGITPTVISLVLNLIIVYSVFSSARPIIKFIGKNGIIAISKIVALLLAAIAVMMIRIGIESYLKT